MLLLFVTIEILLISLAMWQYGRMRDKEHTENTPTPAVLLTGNWDVSHTVVLDNQPNPTNPDISGWRVFTPLQTSDSTIIVDRGWVPFPIDRTAPPNSTDYTPSTNTVQGIRKQFPQRHGWLNGPETTTNSRILAWLNPTLITSATTGDDYLAATTATHPSITAQPPIDAMTSIKHASYALQWTMMAIVFPLCCFGFFRQRCRK